MIELENICAGYGRKTVLQNISGALEPGRLVSIVGPNGSGKSTLLKAITGLLPLQSGQIRLDGQDIRCISRNELAKRIAYLPQGASLPDMTVAQLVLCGRFPHARYPRVYTEHDRKIAWEAMESLEISHLAEVKLPELSGGQRQKTRIAMALAQGTDYIFLDEPTTYLDIAHQLSLLRILRTLAERGKVIALVMHDLPLAFRVSDQIAVLGEGRCLAWDTPVSVLEQKIPQTLFHVPLEAANGNYHYDYQL